MPHEISRGVCWFVVEHAAAFARLHGGAEGDKGAALCVRLTLHLLNIFASCSVGLLPPLSCGRRATAELGRQRGVALVVAKVEHAERVHVRALAAVSIAADLLREKRSEVVVGPGQAGAALLAGHPLADGLALLDKRRCPAGRCCHSQVLGVGSS